MARRVSFELGRRTALAALSLACSTLVLWIGWGNAFDLTRPFHLACSVTNLEGLHFDSALQLVYTDPKCKGEVYRGAWVLFMTVSLSGVLLALNGLYILRLPRSSAFEGN
jgi:hypothetical protein